MPAQRGDPATDSLLVTRAVVDHRPQRDFYDLPRSRIRIRGRFQTTPDATDLPAEKGAIELRLGDYLLAYDADPYWEWSAIERRGRKLRAEYELQSIGSYQPIFLAADQPLPEPGQGLDADAGAARSWRSKTAPRVRRPATGSDRSSRWRWSPRASATPST